MTKRGGFTLVELVVVVVAIGILTGLAVIGLTRYQADTRDAKRSANVSTLSDALEKYFTENGNYPSCEAMTTDADKVTSTTLKGMEKSALLVPDATSNVTNSIRCNEKLGMDGEDFIEYQGDGSTACSADGSCSTYTLKYRDELSGAIQELTSQQLATTQTPAPLPVATVPSTVDTQKLGAPTLSTTVNSATQVTINWTPAAHSTTDTTYSVFRALDSTFTTGVVRVDAITSTSYVTNGLVAGRSYFFKVRAVSAEETGEFSNIVSNSVTPDAPTEVDTTVNSATKVTVAWKAAANATGYQVRYGTTEGAASYTATTNKTSLPVTANITQGTDWYFTVVSFGKGIESVPSASVKASTPIDAPAPFQLMSLNDSVSLTGNASSATCPAGTTRFFSWKANNTAWVQGTNYARATYALANGQNVALKAAVRCQKGSVKSSYTQSSNEITYARAGMNLKLTPGEDGCVDDYCGRTINASWVNICGTIAPTIKAKQLSSLSSWKSSSATSDTIKWKGATSPGVRVTYYDVNIGCTSAAATVNVISAYKCKGCE